MGYGEPIAAIGSPPLRYDQRGNMRGITVQRGYCGAMGYGDPIAAIGLPPLRYDQRGNMRGITLRDL
jgi:hypothetical protein